MRIVAWIGMGLLSTAVCTAFASRWGVAHLVPDMAILVVVFLALRREPIPVVACALALGYGVGRAALAPVGLHETALALVAVGVYLAGGSLSGSGAFFYAITCAVAVMAYHAVLYALLWWQTGGAGFASWPAALLLPAAALTFVAAVLSHAPMSALERRLVQDKREGLTWR